MYISIFMCKCYYYYKDNTKLANFVLYYNIIHITMQVRFPIVCDCDCRCADKAGI